MKSTHLKRFLCVIVSVNIDADRTHFSPAAPKFDRALEILMTESTEPASAEE